MTVGPNSTNGAPTVAERLASARPRDDGVERQRLRAELGARLLAEPLRPPQVGRYVVLRRIGAGAMGVVYSAYDPELDRNLALKLLSNVSDPTDGDRLRREAQALGKLSHPNIVAVYDVGVLDDQVWIAMELVQGQTLRAWIAERPPWPRVLAALLDAGRGLAEAHAAGLVHRDLKPDNIMIGVDGRSRVMDFGLARPLHQSPPTVDRPEPSSRGSTETTAVAGTPAYMADELVRGQPADAHSDQFAYCVTLWEALFGEHPFRPPRDSSGPQTEGSGSDRSTSAIDRLRADVRSGRVRAPGSGTRVPRWLRNAVQRGLAPTASQRWPDLASLLNALEQGRARNRRKRWLVAAGATALALAGLGAAKLHHDHRTREGCQQDGEVVHEFWNDARRHQLDAGLRATGLAHAQRTHAMVSEVLDEYAEDWRSARVESCLDHEVRGVSSPQRLQRSRWCLDDRRFRFEAVVQTLTHASKEVANKAFSKTANLPDLERCTNPSALAQLPAVPPDRRPQIRELRIRAAELTAGSEAGEYASGLSRVRALVDDATAIGWPPLIARAHLIESRYLRSTADHDPAIAAAQAAYFEALRVPAWDTAADAAIMLVGIHSERRDHDAGQLWGRHAQVALEHTADPQGPRAAVLSNNLGTLSKSQGAYAEARARYEQALKIRVRLFSEGHPATTAALSNLATVDYATGDYPASKARLERVVAIRERTLGPNHPDLAAALGNLAVVLAATRHDVAARAAQERALRINESVFGPEHPDVARTLGNLAISYNDSGDHARALELHERALAIRTRKLGPEHPDVATTLDNLGKVHEKLGDLDRAIETRRQALAIREASLGAEHPEVADSLNNLGVMLIRTDQAAKARPVLERALAIRESALGRDHPDVAVVLVNLAALEDDVKLAIPLYRRTLQIREASLEPHDPLVARSLANLALALELDDPGAPRLAELERAVKIYDRHRGVQPREAAARFGLARALRTTGGDADRARTLAEQALAAYREVEDQEEIERIRDWLALQR